MFWGRNFREGGLFRRFTSLGISWDKMAGLVSRFKREDENGEENHGIITSFTISI